MKKYLLILSAIFIWFSLIVPSPALAQEKIKIYDFWSKYCPHCKAENEFLDKLQKERGDFEVASYEVTEDRSSGELFKQFAGASDNSRYSVPALYIGDRSIIGFGDENTTGREIVSALDYYKDNPYVDPLEFMRSGGVFRGTSEIEQSDSVQTTRKLPFVGEIDLKKFSLPALAVILGAVDGFNPCAMWALVALLTLLVSLGSRRKVLLVGGIFLFSSWLITFFFLSAFLNVFAFVRFDLVMRLVIGVVALYSAYQLYKSYLKETEECKVNMGKGKIYKKIEALSNSKTIPFLVLGAITLALMVNVVEFMCSINLPVVFTKVLSLNSLSRLEYYLYIALYDVFYMLDDIVVFLIALFSMKAFTGFNQKYTRFTKLAGAVVMLVLAIMLIFFPRLLAF